MRAVRTSIAFVLFLSLSAVAEGQQTYASAIADARAEFGNGYPRNASDILDQCIDNCDQADSDSQLFDAYALAITTNHEVISTDVNISKEDVEQYGRRLIRAFDKLTETIANSQDQKLKVDRRVEVWTASRFLGNALQRMRQVRSLLTKYASLSADFLNYEGIDLWISSIYACATGEDPFDKERRARAVCQNGCSTYARTFTERFPLWLQSYSNNLAPARRQKLTLDAGAVKDRADRCGAQP